MEHFPDEEGPEGPAGCQPALEELHRQRADEHYGEAPGAARDQKQKVNRIQLTYMPNVLIMHVGGTTVLFLHKNIRLSVISRPGKKPPSENTDQLVQRLISRS